MEDYIIDIDIRDQRYVENLSDEIESIFYKNDVDEIPVVSGNKILSVIAREQVNVVEYRWDIVEKELFAGYLFNWKRVYISSLACSNLIRLYNYVSPPIAIQLINEENIDDLLVENREAVFIYGSDIYSDKIKIRSLSCEQLAREAFDVEVERRRAWCKVLDDWASLEKSEVCLEKVIQLMDGGYKTVNVIDERGNFQSAICRHMVKEKFLYKQIPQWTNLYVNDSSDKEQVLTDLSKVFIGTAREEVAVLKEGKIVASGIDIKNPGEKRSNPNFTLRWELIRDETAQRLFGGLRILISSDRGNLSGFKERFSNLFNITVFREDWLDRYLSGAYDWLIYSADVWCGAPFKSCNVEQLYLDMLSKETVEWLEKNDIAYYYFQAPYENEIWNISGRWFNTWIEQIEVEVVGKNGYVVPADAQLPDYHVYQGYRFVEETPDTYEHTIYFFGPCIALGVYVNDSNTIESILQKKLNENGLKYRVVNCGSVDSAINSFYRMLDTNFKRGDIVVHIGSRAWKGLRMVRLKHFYNCSWIFNTADVCDEKCFVGGKGIHPQEKGNKVLAGYIYSMLQEELNREKDGCNRENIQSPYRPGLNIDNDNLKKYLEKLQVHRTANENVGCIVMNCNPFTLGHYYLVEKGSELSDYLYVFIVEEDKSEFSFEDRYEIARRCCAKFDNVKVLPSGRYIISSWTFGEYFTKDMLQDRVVVPTTDVELFGRYIAPTLNIKKRFVGEEPKDRVTAQYNKLMKEMLPEYGIEVIEYPRYMIQNDVVNASEVRRLLKEGQWEEAQNYLPEESYDIINKKYFHK